MSRRKTIQLEVSMLGNGTGRVRPSTRQGKLLSIARTAAEDVAARSALRVCTIDDVLVELARHRAPRDPPGRPGELSRQRVPHAPVGSDPVACVERAA